MRAMDAAAVNDYFKQLHLLWRDQDQVRDPRYMARHDRVEILHDRVQKMKAVDTRYFDSFNKMRYKHSMQSSMNELMGYPPNTVSQWDPVQNRSVYPRNIVNSELLYPV